MKPNKSALNEYAAEIIKRLKNYDDSWWSVKITDDKNRDWTLRIFDYYGNYVIGVYSKYCHIDAPTEKIEIEQYLLDDNDITAVRLTIQNKLNAIRWKTWN
jgi:hypothetical protein